MNKYVRYGLATLDEVLGPVSDRMKNRSAVGPKRVQIGDFEVNVTSLRLQTFALAHSRGKIKCVDCQLEAKFFALEGFPHALETPPHANLYGTSNGQDVLFTHDHVVARSLGGADNLANTQPMCHPCNQKKAKAEHAEFLSRKSKKELGAALASGL